MEIITGIKELKNKIQKLKSENGKIGFVPTMGALHQGHASLIEQSVRNNDFTVASIFINPTQFNDPKDLLNYPRTPQADYSLLEKYGCTLVFSPDQQEMYPEEPKLHPIDLGQLAEVMEGKFRTGHFQGMATIVYKLLELVRPSSAYFGEKDFQQLAIIKYMVKKLNLPYQIVGCETVREPDGLAISSRNIHLTAEERNFASNIYQNMKKYTAFYEVYGIDEIRKMVIDAIEFYEFFKVEYFEIVDATSLNSIISWQAATELRACIAVKTSKTRLIDNIKVDLTKKY